jgi:hypothetical protein
MVIGINETNSMMMTRSKVEADAVGAKKPDVMDRMILG